MAKIRGPYVRYPVVLKESTTFWMCGSSPRYLDLMLLINDDEWYYHVHVVGRGDIYETSFRCRKGADPLP